MELQSQADQFHDPGAAELFLQLGEATFRFSGAMPSSNSSFADEALGLGCKTIANNCSLIKTKLGVTKTADFLRLALEAGMS